ncbi:MAG: hypothetical protein PUC41_06185 [Oscillospiraceae bacterium]|nr:hypothetical protein [Oscillospiraceae bacterium]
MTICPSACVHLPPITMPPGLTKGNSDCKLTALPLYIGIWRKTPSRVTGIGRIR